MRYSRSATLTLATLLCACSPATDRHENRSDATAQQSGGQTADPSRSGDDAGKIRNETAPSATISPASTTVIGLDGLGDLRIGAAIPQNSSWAVRGAQIDGSCLTASSPEYPGAYAIVFDGQVQRITIGQGSPVKLAENIGIGASEQNVRKRFAGFRAEPHKYADPPAQYLTAPHVGDGSALRFEIGQDSKVKLIHVGRMPALAYVEGCA